MEYPNDIPIYLTIALMHRIQSCSNRLDSSLLQRDVSAHMIHLSLAALVIQLDDEQLPGYQTIALMHRIHLLRLLVKRSQRCRFCTYDWVGLYVSLRQRAILRFCYVSAIEQNKIRLLSYIHHNRNNVAYIFDKQVKVFHCFIEFILFHHS